jgi:hypothetical protein
MYEDDQMLSPKKTVGFAAAWAAGLTLLCIVIGEGAQQFADSRDPAPPVLAAAKGKKPTFNAIDYATTGGVAGQTVILSPCDR